MYVTPFQLVQEVQNLISMPEVLLRVNRLIDDPASTSADVGRVITQDPGLTARLLRIANSSYYGPGRRIDTVARAVTQMGMRQLRDLVLTTAAASVFQGIPNTVISMEDFWRHSIHCALAASNLAKLSGMPNHDGLFVAGLLHDVGQLILLNRYPAESHQALLLAVSDPAVLSVHEAERRIFDFDHTQVGCELIRHWKLPESLQQCVAFHHQPRRAPSHHKEVAIVHLANAIAGLIELGSHDLRELPDFDVQIWEPVSLSSESAVVPTIAVVETQFAEVWELLVSE